MLIEHEVELTYDQYAYRMDDKWEAILTSERFFRKGARGTLLRCAKTGYAVIELPGDYYIEQPWNDGEFCVFRRLTPLEVLAEVAK